MEVDSPLMNVTLPVKKRLVLSVLSLHMVYFAVFLLLLRSVSIQSTLLSLLLIFSCSLLCGMRAGMLSGLSIAIVQTGFLLLEAGEGIRFATLLGRFDMISGALLPVIGLLAGITTEKFSVRNRRLLEQARILDDSNRSLHSNLAHYEQVFQDLSQTRVYTRSWDTWMDKDVLHEQIAGILLSSALPDGSRSVNLKQPTVNLVGLLFAMRPDIVAVLEPDGRITCFNPLLAAVYALDTTNLVGTRFQDLLLPEAAGCATRNMARAMKAELNPNERYGIGSVDGGFSRLLISTEVSLACIGNPIMLIARVSDGSLKAGSYQSEHRTPVPDGLAGLASGDICCLSPDGAILYVSNRIAERIGEMPENMLHQRLERYVSRKAPREYREFVEKVRTGLHAEVDIEMMPHGGDRTFFRLDAYPAVGVSGTFLGASILVENITGVQLVEEALRHRLSMEKLISGISTRFISIRVDEMDREIQQVLRMIGEVEEAEESSVEIFRTGRIQNHVKFQVSRTVPAEGILPNPGLMETIAIPIVIESEKMGFFQFSQKQFSNNWFETDLEMIRLIGEIIISALIRKENEMSIKLNETRLSTTLHSIGDAVIATDNDGLIIMMNKMAETITGWPRDEAYRQPLEVVFQPVREADPEDAGLPADEYPHAMPDALETMSLTSRNGGTCYISINRNPIEDTSLAIFGEVIVFRDITREKQENDKIRYISFHDKLTGLFNRAYFEEEMIRLNTPRQYPITILLGDCNGLKIANDIFGHLEGDKLLQTIAAILKKATRHEDIVARWGGDEFAIILPKTDEQHAGPIRERILQLCGEAPSDPLQPSLALGSATNTDGSNDLVALLKLAEDRMYRHKLTEGKSARNSILLSIEKMLYEKSCETEEHATRIADISRKVGQALGLNDYELEELSLLSKLHDMGKIGIPDSILLKPDKLSETEWELMKKHSEKGYELAKSTPELNNIADLILHHHERWDGTGYPAGLQGENIPKLSRVLSIIDAYDVITHSRAYKPVQSRQEALREIANCAGKQFDPEISRVFIDIMEE